MKLQTGTPLFVRNVVLACNCDSGMQHFLTVQVFTTWRHFGATLAPLWRHPGLSFVNETSLTIRCLRDGGDGGGGGDGDELLSVDHDPLNEGAVGKKSIQSVCSMKLVQYTFLHILTSNNEFVK